MQHWTDLLHSTGGTEKLQMLVLVVLDLNPKSLTTKTFQHSRHFGPRIRRIKASTPRCRSGAASTLRKMPHSQRASRLQQLLTAWIRLATLSTRLTLRPG